MAVRIAKRVIVPPIGIVGAENPGIILNHCKSSRAIPFIIVNINVRIGIEQYTQFEGCFIQGKDGHDFAQA